MKNCSTKKIKILLIINLRIGYISFQSINHLFRIYSHYKDKKNRKCWNGQNDKSTSQTNKKQEVEQIIFCSF